MSKPSFIHIIYDDDHDSSLCGADSSGLPWVDLAAPPDEQAPICFACVGHAIYLLTNGVFKKVPLDGVEGVTEGVQFNTDDVNRHIEEKAAA